jgi:carboxymethylenebutenolidase
MPETMIELTSVDGHSLDAYKSAPDGPPKGGLVIIHEIFGLTGQMKRCADRYAAAGYVCVAPALFDRVDRGMVLGYSEFQKGGETAMSLDEQWLTADADAARQSVMDAGNTAIVGYCFGGTVAYLSASRLDFSCASSYYGGGVARLIDHMQPKVPVMYHFGGDDSFIPLDTVDRIRAADPNGIFHLYDGAGHGFSCDDRDGYDAESAALSEQRTLSFFEEYV